MLKVRVLPPQPMPLVAFWDGSALVMQLGGSIPTSGSKCRYKNLEIIMSCEQGSHSIYDCERCERQEHHEAILNVLLEINQTLQALLNEVEKLDDIKYALRNR